MARPRNRALDYISYLAVRLLVGFAQILSLEQSYALADGLAALLYRVDKRHRKVALENLELAYGDLMSPEDRDRTVREVYRHFCRMLMEILHIPRKLHLETWRDRIELKSYRDVLERLFDGGPVIMLSGHFGNWEMAGYLFGVFGFPPYSVARTLDNPHLERFLRSFRERTGQKLIPKKGGYDEMLDVLKRGGVLSFLADQDAGERGMFVDFFGRPASTHKAIALLAIEHKAPVVVGYARRIGPGFRYEVGCEELILPSEWTGTADDARLLTQRYTSALERIVRRDPEQYLWLHRRWKHKPKAKRAPSSKAPAAPESEIVSPP
ncbi:lysophospholipid acyltransferase family protein [Isosphaeraceae bacterium EP7]